MSEYVGDVSKRGTACHQIVKPVLAMYIAIKRLLKACLLGTLLLDAATGGAQTFTVLKHFAGSDGANPLARLTLSGGTLYGTTYQGGNSSGGTVFKVNTDSTGYTVLKKFAYSEGVDPRAGLTVSGSTLYGAAYSGGSSGSGSVFKINLDGTGFTVLKNFAASPDGIYPAGELTLSGSTLYGTTYSGGNSGYGTVFKVNTDGQATPFSSIYPIVTAYGR